MSKTLLDPEALVAVVGLGAEEEGLLEEVGQGEPGGVGGFGGGVCGGDDRVVEDGRGDGGEGLSYHHEGDYVYEGHFFSATTYP